MLRSRVRRRDLIKLAGAGLGGAGLAALLGSQPAALAAPTQRATGQAAKVFRIANAEPTWTLDPGQAVTSASWRVVELLTDPLLDRDAEFKLVPWLAERWESGENGRVWEFTLRSGARFSDGSPITAADVKFSFEYYKTTDLWKSKLAILDRVETPDERTARLVLTEPRLDFFDLPMFSVQYAIISKAAVEAAGSADQGKVAAVSGPYVLKEYVPKSHLVLTRNPHYWRLAEGYPRFEEIRWNFTEDATAGVAAVESDSADLYSPVPAASVDRLKQNPAVQVFQTKSPNYIGWGMLKDKPPFSDQRVRQALGMSTEPDERTLVCWFNTGSSLYGGTAYPWQSFYNKENPVEPWKRPRAERLEAARKLLDEAGWVLGADGLRVSRGVAGIADGTPFEFDAPFEANWPASGCHAQLLQKWMGELGIQVNPVAYDPSIFWQDVGAGKMQFWHSGWYSYLSARENYRNNFHTQGSGNKFLVAGGTPELDRAIEAAEKEPDPTRQMQMYWEIERMCADLQLAFIMGSQDTLVLTTARLKGFFPRVDDSNRALIISDLE